MKSIIGIFIGAGLFAALTLHAAPLRSSTATDLSAMVAAVSQTEPTPAGEVPPFGSFYSAQNPDNPPLPADINALSAWNLGNGMWLLDDLDADRAANTMLNRMRGMNDGLPVPGEGGGDSGDYTNSFVSYLIDTNQLWLEITNVSNGLSFANLHNATNQVYAIWSATELATPFALWNVETEVWPTDTNCQPFAVQNYAGQNLFLRAEDWTGVDSDGDGIPDWWIWKYFGDLSEMVTNLDSQGNTLGYDFANDITPTVFAFTNLEVANNYVTASSTPVQLDVAGSPYYVATLIDDNNFSNAVWNPYSGSTVSVNLGFTEGWHNVWIGLRGHGDEADAAVWQWKRLKLDFTPPALIVTGPTNGTVDVPLIQLTGYSSEALSCIDYDLSNAAGTLTNQQVLVLNQHFDSAKWECTTNIFQAFDIPLTNGMNTITLHATDLAGNVSTFATNISLDFSAKTNPPSVQLTWPLDGMAVIGDNFTMRGQVDDPTATINASVVDLNGVTNTVAGMVERNGRFWLDNLPLAGGTNIVFITISDAAGNVSGTNLNLVQSSLTLTMDSIPDPMQLWQPTVSVSGEVSDPSASIWVNGVAGTNNGDGTWNANNVPVTSGGVACFDVTAGPSGSGGNPLAAGAANMTTNNVDKPARLYVASYGLTNREDWNGIYGYLYDASGNLTYAQSLDEHDRDTIIWGNGQGGCGTMNEHWTQYFSDDETITGCGEYHAVNLWPTNQWENLSNGVMTTSYIINWTNQLPEAGGATNACSPVPIVQEHCGAGGRVAVAQYNQSHHYGEGMTWGGDYQYHRDAQAVMKLETGGRAGSSRQSLFCLNVTVEAQKLESSLEGYDQIITTDAGPIDPGKNVIYIGALGQLGADGNLWVMLPDGTNVDVTPFVAGVDYYTFNDPPGKYTPHITANANISLDPDEVVPKANFCVGQYIQFDVAGLPGSIVDVVAVWTLPGTYVNTNSDPNCDLFYEKNTAFLKPPQGTTSTHCWYVKDDQSLTASVHVYYRYRHTGPLFDKVITGKFNVHRPTTANATPYQPDGTPTAQAPGVLSLGISGVTNDMSFKHTITTDAFCAGQAGYVQVITYSDIKGAGSASGTFTGDALDGALGEFPTDRQTTVPANTTTTLNKFYDAPSVGLSSSLYTTEDVHFSTYLMFNPGGAGSIWVPLRLIQWELHDTATYNSGWSAISSTDDEGHTQTTTQNPSGNDNESTAFPIWTTTK